MVRVTPCIIALVLTLCLPSFARAEERVAVRTGEHSGYVRIVFDWPSPAGYTITAEKDQLTVTFDRAAALDLSAVDTADSHFVRSVAPQGSNSAIIMTAPGTKHSAFQAGNRVIIDVAGGDSAAASQKTQTAAKTEEKKPEPSATKKTEPVLSQQKKPELKKPETKAAPEVAAVKPEAVEKTALEKALPKIAPHVVTLSMTEAAGVAAFIRNNDFWIVMDRPDIVTPPELSGPTPDVFSPFQRYEIKGGAAFRMDLPESQPLHIYGEGGGLIWRFVITPQERHAPPVTMSRGFAGSQTARGGTANWGLSATQRILDVPDPAVGDVLKVITVSRSDQFTGPGRDFVDFRLLDSVTGMALAPRVDDLDIKLAPSGIEITRPDGLALSRTKDVSRSLMRQEVAESAAVQPSPQDAASTPFRRIYDFDRWMMGGVLALGQNERILLGEAGIKDQQGRVQDLLTLAKMSIANDRGQEAAGLLGMAESELPAVAQGAEYKALRGAANALAGKCELAADDFAGQDLKAYTELDYWRAFTFACLEDWQQARRVMPKDYSVLSGYPKGLLEKIGLKLAEVALRGGDVKNAESILATMERDRAKLGPSTVAGMDYLKGEAHRQSGEADSARKLWEPLTKGKDDLYRAKAGLALTMLDVQTGKIKPEEAVDRLEGLRYAWRGDELEAQINFMLGKLYLEQRRFLKGFAILREAAGMSPDSDTGHEIAAYMADRFKTLLLDDKDLSALDAVSVYEEFTDLTPAGEEGNKLVQRLAERLVEADLLDRATALLQHQVDSRVKDNGDKARVALRLAAVYLLDNDAVKAMGALDTAYSYYSGGGIDPKESSDALRRISLMRARALSEQNKTEEALEILNKFEPAPDVNRLKADIAWKAGLWEDAAEGLQDLILDQGLDPNRPLTEKQAEMILNQAVAYNLSGNRVALGNVRKRYGDGMKKTARAKLFDVVTRPRQSTLLSDRATLDSLVSEVDIFKDFLETYRSGDVSN